MRKPSNYKNINSNIRGYEKLDIGGHECIVVKAEQKISKSGTEMLVVHLDTAPTDKQPNFYKRRFDADTRAERKWGCVVTFFDDGQEFNDQKSVNFVSAICEANGLDEDTFDWEKIDKIVQGKRVCAVFREEEYKKNDGTIGVAIKPFVFKAMEELKNGNIKIPKKKELQSNKNSNDIFGDNLTPVHDEEMPF